MTESNCATVLPIDPEVERLTKAQLDLPAACAASNRVDPPRQGISLTSKNLDNIKKALLCCVLVIILVSSIAAAISSGDFRKLEAGTQPVLLLAQALAINANGTSTTAASV